MTVVMIKPTNSCNLGCTYCYNTPVFVKKPTDLMSYETMEAALTKITRYENDFGREVEFEWIGGEPLLAGREFYQSVVEVTLRLKRQGYKLHNVIQSNGTLLTDKAVDFFVENEFEMGFSLDGVKEINDKTRIDLGGKGTYDRVIRGIMRYKEKTGHAGVVTVVNKQNMDYVEDLYELCKELRIGLQLNGITFSGDAVKNWEELVITPEDYVNAVLNVFQLWINEKEVVGSESVLEGTVLNILTGQKDTFGNCVTKQSSCQDPSKNHLIAVNPKGDVYPCTGFDGEIEFLLGNINDVDDFAEIAESDLRKHLIGRNQRVYEKTGEVDIGCLSAAYHTNGNIDTIDPMAKARQKIRSEITITIDSILENSRLELVEGVV